MHQPGFAADILREPAALDALLDDYAAPGGPLADVRLSGARRIVLLDLYLTKHRGYRALLFTGSRYDPEVMTWARERASSIGDVGRTIEGAALHIPVPDGPLVAVLVETMVAELAAGELWRRRP